VKNSKKNSTYSHTNIRSYLTVEFLKKEFFFAWPFSGLHGGSFSVFLEKHSQGTLGVNDTMEVHYQMFSKGNLSFQDIQ
jgi:hypothetical protein